MTPARTRNREKQILVRGAREHNLQALDIAIPREQLVVVTGPSGSGKSSLVFDTLFAESQRRYMESLSSYARNMLRQLPRPNFDVIEGLPPAMGLRQRSSTAGPQSTVGTRTEAHDYLRVLFGRLGTLHCSKCDEPVQAWTVEEIIERVHALEEETRLTVLAPALRDAGASTILTALKQQGFVRVRANGTVVNLDDERLQRMRLRTLEVVIDRLTVRTAQRTRLGEAIEAALACETNQVIIAPEHGSEQIYSGGWMCAHCGTEMPALGPELLSFNTSAGACPRCEGAGEIASSDREQLGLCPVCGGSRLRAEAGQVRFAEQSFLETIREPIEDVQRWVRAIELTEEQTAIGAPVVRGLRTRLDALCKLGLGYLSLNRGLDRLSSGERQRVRLVTTLGTGLVGVLYVLDEPTVGLHPRDVEAVVGLLREAQKEGNTVLVVEHDLDVMRQADLLIELGPGAGSEGGQLVSRGAPDEVAQDSTSISGPFLRGETLRIASEARPRSPNALRLTNASANNLQHVDLELPIKALSCVTGVSGSGKSSLVMETLVPRVHKALSRAPVSETVDVGSITQLVVVDASPIGRTPRSNAATYTDMMQPLRQLFASLPESRARGYSAARFSFNAKGGRCENCQGAGTVHVQMELLPDVYVPCDVCRGKRYTRATLEVRYRGLSIADVLEHEVDHALSLFEAVPPLFARLEALRLVGLGYLQLGQAANTLSGGEAQRIKLARELAKRSQGGVLYVLDEPTQGLHPKDIVLLMRSLHGLVDQGHTVVLVDNDLHVLASADWVVELGPGAGPSGGQVVATGTPKELMGGDGSPTGELLNHALQARTSPRGEKRA